MATPGTILRLTVRQRDSIVDSASLNVFHYAQVDNPVPGANTSWTLAQLQSAIARHILSAVNTIQSINIVNEICSVQSLSGDEVFADLPFAGRGAVNDSSLPPFTCHAFRFPRVGTNVKGGAKRFIGVTEGQLVNSQEDATLYTNPFILLVESFLAGELTYISGSTVVPTGLVPIVLSLQKDGQPRTLPVGERILSCRYAGITSQVSRKKGRGI